MWYYGQKSLTFPRQIFQIFQNNLEFYKFISPSFTGAALQ